MNHSANTSGTAHPTQSTEEAACSSPESNHGLEKNSKRNAWTSFQKEFICVFYRWYENSAKDLTQIFNYTFRDEIHQSYAKAGAISVAAIHSQLSDLSRKTKLDEYTFDNVFNTNFSTSLHQKFTGRIE